MILREDEKLRFGHIKSVIPLLNPGKAVELTLGCTSLQFREEI